jgi:hypothetical protein
MGHADNVQKTVSKLLIRVRHLGFLEYTVAAVPDFTVRWHPQSIDPWANHIATPYQRPEHGQTPVPPVNASCIDGRRAFVDCPRCPAPIASSTSAFLHRFLDTRNTHSAHNV